VPTEPTRTRTRPEATTAPATTEPEPTPEPTTTEIVPTVPETTTRPTLTVTLETQTTTAPEPVVPTTAPTTTEAEPEPATTAVAAPPTAESSEETPWGWIALVLGAAAAVVIGLLWRSRRAGAASWANRRANLTQRALIVLDDVLAQGSVVTGQVEALAAEAGSLEQRAPNDAAKADAARIRSRLDGLAGALESDRTLRLSSPPPSAEQVSYSTVLIRQQVQELQGVLRSTDPPV